MDLNTVENIVKSAVSDSGLILLELSVKGEGKNSILEVYADSEKGADIDILSEVNRRINRDLDLRGLSEYFNKIIVSSPGTDKPLKFIWQLNRHCGKIITFYEENIKIEGKLINVDNVKGSISVEIKIGKKDFINKDFLFDKIADVKIKLPF